MPDPTIVPAAGADSLRAEMRAACLRKREALASSARERLGAAICAGLLARFPSAPAPTVGFCWPVRGEPDIRPVVRAWIRAGARAALPVVDRTAKHLDFHRWDPDRNLADGPFGIPVPATTEALRPGCLLVPMVGFDAAGYRLGYGGGYFDRTLAPWEPRPLLIGVAFELSRLDSVLPQAHDVPVDWVATETGVFRAARPA
jgi:5,10-methenyltetrahydrofolate synthetase